MFLEVHAALLSRLRRKVTRCGPSGAKLSSPVSVPMLSLLSVLCLFAFVLVVSYHKFFDEIPEDGLFPIGVAVMGELFEGAPLEHLRVDYVRKFDSIVFVGCDERVAGKRMTVSLRRHPFEIWITEGSSETTVSKKEND